MPKETYEPTRNEAQNLNIEELVKFGKEMTVRLRIADAEIGRLRLTIENLESDRFALVVKLENAENEVGRLDMVLRHRTDSMKNLK